MTQKEIDKTLPVDAFDSADEALDALVRAMRSGVQATIRTIEIGVHSIGSGRWGTPTENDMVRIDKLKVLLEQLRGGQKQHNNN